MEKTEVNANPNKGSSTFDFFFFFIHSPKRSTRLEFYFDFRSIRMETHTSASAVHRDGDYECAESLHVCGCDRHEEHDESRIPGELSPQNPKKFSP